jgi:DNA (cytosine-5)-methyltransferase 1
LAVAIPETDVVGALSDGAHMGGGLNGQDAYTGRLLAVAQGADVYNGEVTGDTAATVTSATGIANASGPKVVGWNGDVTPKSSEDVSVTLRSQQGGEGVGVAQMNATLERVDGETVEGMCEMRGATMVRRLTPMECERLQGFEDGWTEWKQIVELEGNEWVRVELKQKQKDGPRYRQMGNAVSVPVAEYIGRRMAEAVDE